MAHVNSLAEAYKPIPIVEDPYTLDGLRYESPYFDELRNKQILITPESVQNFVSKINEIESRDHRPLMIVIGAGGTPTMLPTGAGNSLEPQFNTEQLLTKTDPEVHDEFQILAFDAFVTDSSQLDIDDVGDLAIAMRYMWQEMKPSLKARFAGFGIIHGSDTMDESSNHLEMMFGRHQPFNVVHTGTEKSTDEDPYELWRNLRYMLYTLDALYESQLAEGLTVFDEKLLLTAGLVYGENGMDTPLHRHVTDVASVLDRDHRKLPGWLRKDYSGWEGSDPFVVYRGESRVGILPARMAENQKFIETMVRDLGYVAILLVTHHSGTFDAKVMEKLSKLIEKEHHEIPLFAINSVPTEKKPRVDTYAASAQWMLDMNVQPLDMTIEAAQAKLMRLIADPERESPHHPQHVRDDHHDPKGLWLPKVDPWNVRLHKLRKAMTTNYLGEIPNDQNRRPRKRK